MLFAVALCIGVFAADAAVRTQSSPQRGTTTNSHTQSISKRTTDKKVTSTKSRTTSNIVARTTGNVTPRTTTKSITTSRTAIPARSATATSRNNKNVVRTATNLSRSARVSTARAASAQNVNTNTFGTGYNVCRDAYFTCMDQFCAQQNETYRRCACSSKLTEIKSRETALGQTASQIQDFKDLNIAVIPKTGEEVKAMLSAAEGEAIASTIRDKSGAAQQLAGISAVLSSSKSQSLSTLGTLDIAGDINEIWATTDLTSGVNIANLYGEALYNAVHAQCANLVASSCASTATLNMVVSAYGMYIENDCSALINALDKKLNAANGTIRATEREMNSARLDNYNAHNSTTINDCIAQVRADITADNACGKDYVHCLDVTGRYLTYETGTPIYSPEFYQLEAQISLSGDVLTNTTNRTLVAELNRKRIFAERGLETCRDLADEVWDEFMRQAIAEIYQNQQEKVRQVKTECLNVVNQCYDEQSQSLKDFSNVKDQLLIGSRLELSEQMCREKLYACANLYGEGGSGMQLLLASMHSITDQKIANNCRVALQEYAQEMCAVPSNDTLHGYPYGCRVYVPGSQQYATIYECNQQIWGSTSTNIPTKGDGDTGSGGTTPDGGNTGGDGSGESGGETPQPPTPPTPPAGSGYVCPEVKKYTSCAVGYYMTYNGQYDGEPKVGNLCTPCPESTVGTTQCDGGQTDFMYSSCNSGYYMTYNGVYDGRKQAGNQCTPCPEGQTCTGGTNPPGSSAPPPTEETPNPEEEWDGNKLPSNCDDYPGSLYQKLVRYAIQTCVRPSESSAKDYVLPTTVLEDVNVVMDSIRSDMGKSLAAECERLGGTWVATQWTDQIKNDQTTANQGSDGKHDTTGHSLYKLFYDETGSNTKWGFCADTAVTDATTTDTTTSTDGSTTDNGGTA